MKGKILKYWNSLNKKKKILLSIIVCLTLVEVSSLFLMYQSLINKNSLLDSVSLKNSDKSNGMFAIYLQQEDKSYKETDRTTWPTEEEGYVYSSAKSGCIDSNGKDLGDALTYDKSNNSVSIKTKGAAKCYLYFNIKAIGDVVVSVSTDGEAGLPTVTGYKQNLSCGSDQAIFNQKYQRIEIGESTSCDLIYTKDTETHTLLTDEVEANTTNYSAELGDFTNATRLTESEYGTPEMFYVTSHSGNGGYNDTSGTTSSNLFTYSDNVWKSIPSNLKSYYNFIRFSMPSDGYYQLCYSVSSENNGSIVMLLNGSQYWMNGNSEFSVSKNSSGCLPLGLLNSGDTIQFGQYHSWTYDLVEISFYIEKTDDTQIIDAGYRYIDKTPDNYIWFNNEMWRIIGSIPTKQADGTTENLVKIIRETSIGNFAYDVNTDEYTGEWGTNSLYTLLNNYYFGKKDASEENYCDYIVEYPSNSTKRNCDFSNKGLSPTSFYGKMVKNVYWNTGLVNYSADYIFGENTNSELFRQESQNQTVSGYVGLINYTDFDAADGNSDNVYRNNWLYTQGYEWTSVQEISKANSVAIMGHLGYVWNTTSTNYYHVRPVVYLDSTTYIISGTGSITDPYIIGM